MGAIPPDERATPADRSDEAPRPRPSRATAWLTRAALGVGRARATTRRTSDITFSLIYELVLRLPSSTYCHAPPVPRVTLRGRELASNTNRVTLHSHGDGRHTAVKRGYSVTSRAQAGFRHLRGTRASQSSLLGRRSYAEPGAGRGRWWMRAGSAAAAGARKACRVRTYAAAKRTTQGHNPPVSTLSV